MSKAQALSHHPGSPPKPLAVLMKYQLPASITQLSTTIFQAMAITTSKLQLRQNYIAFDLYHLRVSCALCRADVVQRTFQTSSILCGKIVFSILSADQQTPPHIHQANTLFLRVTPALIEKPPSRGTKCPPGLSLFQSYSTELGLSCLNVFLIVIIFCFILFFPSHTGYVSFLS